MQQKKEDLTEPEKTFTQQPQIPKPIFTGHSQIDLNIIKYRGAEGR